MTQKAQDRYIAKASIESLKKNDLTEKESNLKFKEKMKTFYGKQQMPVDCGKKTILSVFDDF